MWWVDFGWMPGTHQTTVFPPFQAGQRRQSQMENNPQVEIRQFAKAKEKFVHA